MPRTWLKGRLQIRSPALSLRTDCVGDRGPGDTGPKRQGLAWHYRDTSAGIKCYPCRMIGWHDFVWGGGQRMGASRQTGREQDQTR